MEKERKPHSPPLPPTPPSQLPLRLTVMETSPFSCQGHADSASEAPACWLCLCGTEAGPLTLPCKCPSMYSHPMCLGRWQLQQAGREEERCCRFCHSPLPGWTESLLDDPTAQLSTAVPIMAVVFNGRMVKLPCIPGKEGAELFKKQIREIFHLDESVSLDVTFELKVPAHEESHTGQKVYLKGFHTFEAASTVAAICAAKRMARNSATSAPGNNPSTSSTPAFRSISSVQPRPVAEPQFSTSSVPIPLPRRSGIDRSASSALPSVSIADSSASSFSYGDEYQQHDAALQQRQQQQQQQQQQQLQQQQQQQQQQEGPEAAASKKKTVGSEIVRKIKTLFGIRSSSASGRAAA